MQELARAHTAITDKALTAESVYQLTLAESGAVGAICLFSGHVREYDHHLASGRLTQLHLQYYAGLTEASLNEIVADAHHRWELEWVSVVHRVGTMSAGDTIVVVSVSALHRAAAFDAARFIMDQLKTRALLWKRVADQDEAVWVDVKASDINASNFW